MNDSNNKATNSDSATDSDVVESKVLTNTEALDRARASMSPKEAVPAPSSPGIIILQWLTYAFWGWTLLAFVWLTFIVFASSMTPMDLSGMVPYAIAASLVLLPIAVLCDIFYLRKEPAKKHGAAMVVMVIHAVIFALFGIGILITGVVTLVNMAIESPSDSSTQIAWISTAFLSAAVYALTFLRTLNPFSSNVVAKWFWVVIAIVMTGFVIASFIGPVAQVRVIHEDQKIEQAIEGINYKIQSAAEKDGELPGALGELELDDETAAYVRKGTITYAPEAVTQLFYQGTQDLQKLGQAQPKKLHYQLCATYQRQSAYYSAKYAAETAKDEEYSSYLSVDSHPAGKTCYKLEITTEQ